MKSRKSTAPADASTELREDAYDSIPSTGVHRGARPDTAVTTSVRAQEAVDPTKKQSPRPAPARPPAARPGRKTAGT